MAAKKTATAKKKATPNKSAFVRSLPAAMPGAEVVSKAKAAGIKISLAYVYGIRAKSNARKRSSSNPKQGPARARQTSSANGVGAHRSAGVAGGLVGEIERIVEAKVAELLKARLGAILN